MRQNLLIVDDDTNFRSTLAGVLGGRGFEVMTAASAEEAVEVASQQPPEYVVLDFKMPGGTGLSVIPRLLALDAYTRIVVLTGYAGINTAVEAIKLGAVHYLAKPVTAEELLEAFHRTEGNPEAPIEEETLPLNDVEWQHILSVLERNQGNISGTARELKMHRRTLQRKLEKRGWQG